MEKIQNSHLGQRSLDFLQKMKLIVKNEDGTMQASVSGILMASDAPETFLSNALIQTVCYRGTERTAAHQIDAKNIMESERLSGKKPVYRLIDDSELMLTIFAAPSPHGDD